MMDLYSDSEWAERHRIIKESGKVRASKRAKSKRAKAKKKKQRK